MLNIVRRNCSEVPRTETLQSRLRRPCTEMTRGGYSLYNRHLSNRNTVDATRSDKGGSTRAGPGVCSGNGSSYIFGSGPDRHQEVEGTEVSQLALDLKLNR
ncbi:hypothetical protein E6O75_ATG07792 [Venturia nashicola]|uniref:Uncharacterized protein n=1 Tax=Venturia nashicola TaxID=86259 RepID=A0A4Z1NZQ9_9PEZI|nr:hypothetical protein E6O75_ATG07792 [Venturia nashicola]